MSISKVEEKKQIKRDKLLASAYTLFLTRGFIDTSINDIVDYAGVAKGTFYLYFKDKWDIKDQVIIEKSRLLIDEAIINANNKMIDKFDEKIISITNYIIDDFINNKDLLKLINKNLSFGLFNKVLESEYINIKEMFAQELKNYNNKIKNPEVVLYMIIELIGSSIYSSIIYDIPLSINEYKPYLFEQIINMIK
jgi:AcrR family transcriptional regulator